jgi:hypothetical protein
MARRVASCNRLMKSGQRRTGFYDFLVVVSRPDTATSAWRSDRDRLLLGGKAIDDLAPSDVPDLS